MTNANYIKLIAISYLALDAFQILQYNSVMNECDTRFICVGGAFFYYSVLICTFFVIYFSKSTSIAIAASFGFFQLLLLSALLQYSLHPKANTEHVFIFVVSFMSLSALGWLPRLAKLFRKSNEHER